MSISGVDWMLKSAFQTELTSLNAKYPKASKKKNIKQHLKQRIEEIDLEIEKARVKLTK